MSTRTTVPAQISLPSNFVFGEVRSIAPAVRPAVAGAAVAAAAPAPTPAPDLGPIAAFVGTFTGSGFNTIFRPNNSKTPTPLPIPVVPGDNILELNLTTESLAFSPSLGSVPNRGTTPQGDIFLNGVPYLQTIQDVTTAGQSVGIHAEPGLWMSVPPTDDPAEGSTVARMGSIPHGTTIQAQGTSLTVAGGPIIAPVDITPFVTGSSPKKLIPFASQTAATPGTPRIPQDLTSFIAAGTITQAMLTDPNTVLRNQIAGQTITSTTVILIDTNPTPPIVGGGTDNVAFLQGNPPASAPNAQAVEMSAIFWVETVQTTLLVPPFPLGPDPIILPCAPSFSGQIVPSFCVQPPPAPITSPVSITVTYTQIQYSQQVFLNFAGLTWPHISVATLVPAAPVQVPASVWATATATS